MGDIHFKVISATENSNEFKKNKFSKEKSVENVGTLERLPFNSSMISFHIWLLKNGYMHCKTMFTCCVSLFFSGFTLGPRAKVSLVLIKFDMFGFFFKCINNMSIV